MRKLVRRRPGTAMPVRTRHVSSPAAGTAALQPAYLQTRLAGPGHSVGAVGAVRAAGARGPAAGTGTSLSAAQRSHLEPVLGTDLSPVRVHEDEVSRGLAHMLGARAFAHGDHVWLGEGARRSDPRLLAHEVTHTVQQRGGPPALQRLARSDVTSRCLAPGFASRLSDDELELGISIARQEISQARLGGTAYRTLRGNLRVFLRERHNRRGGAEHPFIFMRPTRLRWYDGDAVLYEQDPRRYVGRIGCIPGQRLLQYTLAGEARIGIRETGDELPYTRANHRRYFPGMPFLADAYIYTSVRTAASVSSHVSHVPRIDGRGGFEHSTNLIRFTEPLAGLDLYLRARDPGMYESRGSYLRLENRQGPGELIDVCEPAREADAAAVRASERASVAAARVAPPGATAAGLQVNVAPGELERLNHYLMAVGLQVAADGRVSRESGWTSPDRWRWISRNGLLRYMASGAGGTVQWTASDVYDWLRNDRDVWLGESGPPLAFDVFIGELRRYEDANPGMTIDAEIRALRRACHEPSLPFDQVIGVPRGGAEEYATGGIGGPLQFLKDHNAVRVGGAEVDMYHLFVGLEALPLDRPDVELEYDLGRAVLVWPTAMESAAAATWAGDLGSALADWVLGVDGSQEPSGGMEPKLDYYWRTRAAPRDLDGDIDAWGITSMRRSMPPDLSRLSDLLLYYYRDEARAANRRNAYQDFMAYYSLPGGGDLDVNRIRTQIMEFAGVWLMKRLREGFGNVRYTTAEYEWAADELTSRLIVFVEDRSGP